jgi:hypothetical protein
VRAIVCVSFVARRGPGIVGTRVVATDWYERDFVGSLPQDEDKLPLRKIAYRTANDDSFQRSTHVQIVALGWAYVVLMMTLAEALGPGGSVLGAIVTLLLYGVLPLGIVLYIGGARGRARARRLASASGDVDPGRGGEPAGEAVAPVREEP